ncbi:thioredoxin [Aspergillus sclerotioniger CBS 115572]|uniref:Thioredoxin n=1 Tax=Aspergillus sclerotioniger CBS 115572 TaxID=1450535 RepID=A0A317VZS2_9EURO|nr:thioredoxin [Aspergillus sclerotioniger CBS 115572]PWY78438.1 thioredoxin [Aspergillus sclerotioniger CBS 115572]
MTNFNIQIISDTVCPWCYVGFRRLSRAISIHKTAHPADTFTLNWHAFYLNPASPSFPGLDKTEFYKSKFGADRTTAIFGRLAAVGQADGIAFSFGGRTGNTRDSHRLLWYAGQKEKEGTVKAEEGAVGGLQTRVAEQLFRAYFEDEKNITDPEVLVQAAVGAGLERAAVEQLLASEEGGKEVDLEAERARRQLVTGVPYYMVQGQYAVEGADEPDTFLEVFEQVKKSA